MNILLECSNDKNMYKNEGNIRKALQSFSKVIVCSDDRKLIQSLSDKIKTQNVRCALVQDVIDAYRSMQTDAASSIR